MKRFDDHLYMEEDRQLDREWLRRMRTMENEEEEREIRKSTLKFEWWRIRYNDMAETIMCGRDMDTIEPPLTEKEQEEFIRTRDDFLAFKKDHPNATLDFVWE